MSRIKRLRQPLTAARAALLLTAGFVSSAMAFSTGRTPTDTITDTNASFNPYTFPGRFPGWFRACVRNVNTTPINVTLLMNGQ